jgi:hypothetical protein
MFEYSPDTAGSAFRSQGHTVAVAVGKGVHFLLYDVSNISDGALEYGCIFEDRKTDLSVAITAQNIGE